MLVGGGASRWVGKVDWTCLGLGERQRGGMLAMSDGESERGVRGRCKGEVFGRGMSERGGRERSVRERCRGEMCQGERYEQGELNKQWTRWNGRDTTDCRVRGEQEG